MVLIGGSLYLLLIPILQRVHISCVVKHDLEVNVHMGYCEKFVLCPRYVNCLKSGYKCYK